MAEMVCEHEFDSIRELAISYIKAGGNGDV